MIPFFQWLSEGISRERCSIGVWPAASSCGSILFSSKPQLRLNSSCDFRMVGHNRLGKVGGSGVEACFISVPVNKVCVTIGTNIGVGSPHHHHFSISNGSQLSLCRLLNFILRLKGVPRKCNSPNQFNKRDIGMWDFNKAFLQLMKRNIILDYGLNCNSTWMRNHQHQSLIWQWRREQHEEQPWCSQSQKLVQLRRRPSMY